MKAQGQNELGCVYLAVGADDLMREATIERLKSHIVPAWQDFDVQEFQDLVAFKADTLASALSQLPLGGKRRVVILRDIGALPQECTDFLVDYVQNPVPTTTLLLTTEKLAKTTRLRKAIEKIPGATIACDVPTGYKFNNYVCELAQKRYGLTLSRPVAEEIAARTGQVPSQVEGALKTLKTFAKTPYITVEDVKQHILSHESPKPWTFADALSQKNTEIALEILHKTPEAEYLRLFWYATQRIREFIRVKGISTHPTSQAIASLLGGPAWKYKNYPVWCENFTVAHLKNALINAADLSETLKGTGDSKAQFMEWVVKTTQK